MWTTLDYNGCHEGIPPGGFCFMQGSAQWFEISVSQEFLNNIGGFSVFAFAEPDQAETQIGVQFDLVLSSDTHVPVRLSLRKYPKQMHSDPSSSGIRGRH